MVDYCLAQDDLWWGTYISFQTIQMMNVPMGNSSPEEMLKPKPLEADRSVYEKVDPTSIAWANFRQ